jgi:hypothetical protein
MNKEEQNLNNSENPKLDISDIISSLSDNIPSFDDDLGQFFTKINKI